MAIFNTILYIVAIVCAVWVIYDVFKNNRKLSNSMKILWTVLAILFSIITAIVYYILYKR